VFRLGGPHQPFRLLRADADQHAALATGGDGHVPFDQEGQAPEHLPLVEAVLGPDELAKPIGQLLVVGHGEA
jgi:hypothetical protein